MAAKWVSTNHNILLGPCPHMIFNIPHMGPQNEWVRIRIRFLWCIEDYVAYPNFRIVENHLQPQCLMLKSQQRLNFLLVFVRSKSDSDRLNPNYTVLSEYQ